MNEPVACCTCWASFLCCSSLLMNDVVTESHMFSYFCDLLPEFFLESQSGHCFRGQFIQYSCLVNYDERKINCLQLRKYLLQHLCPLMAYELQFYVYFITGRASSEYHTPRMVETSVVGPNYLTTVSLVLILVFLRSLLFSVSLNSIC